MKYYKKLNQYKASNVVFDVATQTAWSYGWWAFVKPISGKLVYNDYYYSTATRGHQSKVRRLLDYPEFDLIIEAPDGLQSRAGLLSAIEHDRHEIKRLIAEIRKPRSQKKKNEERKEDIRFYLNRIKQVKELLK